jgi:hypothetical protein
VTTFEWIQTGASIATAAGVVVAAWQLFLAKQQARSQFEDDLTTQYRHIVNKIPLEALLGQPLTDAQLVESLRFFYEYFDLSNEQAFLFKRGRIRSDTWGTWREGIEQHMARPAFRQAWLRLVPHLDGSFDDFRELLPPLSETVRVASEV